MMRMPGLSGRESSAGRLPGWGERLGRVLRGEWLLLCRLLWPVGS